MRIVLATHSFAAVGGSETYLLTLAEQLLRLGHGVTLYALVSGDMAELARARAVDVAPTLNDLGERCDVVIAQDGGVAYELADRWPQTPQVFVCHSALFDLQLPPLVPGVADVVVVLSDRIERRVRALDVPHRIVRLRQPIDTERLMPRSAPRERPRRALLLGNYLRGDARRVLADAWASQGVEVVQVGAQATVSLHPEKDIADADVVVGKGRAVLDAMSCGRAAYVYDAFGTDGWVTPEVYPLMEAEGFSGQALPRVVDEDRLARDLDAYRPLMGQANRELVMNHHQARAHAEQIVDLCRELAPRSSPHTTAGRELARLVRLKWRAEAELFTLRNEFAEAARRADEAAADVAKLRAEIAALEERTRRAERAANEADAALRALANLRRVRAVMALGRLSWLPRTSGRS